MILQKEEIKYIFNPYNLLPGDILLMKTRNFIQDFGLYQDIEYQPRNLDIGFLLKDILKVLG